MKRIFCLITALCLVFGSFSFVFAADWSSTDSQNLANAAGRLYYMNQSAAYYLYNIASNTSSLVSKTTDIYNALFNSGHNITYWIHEIFAWMNPIYTSINSIPTDLESLLDVFIYPNPNISGSTFNYIEDLFWANANVSKLVNNVYNLDKVRLNSHANLINDYTSGKYTMRFYSRGAGTYGNYDLYWSNGSPLGNIATEIWLFSNSFANWTSDVMTGFNSTQNALNWGNNSTSTFTPSSAIDGIYKWFAAIQAPVSRLSYVLANDEDIEAREAAAANQQAVVDNFIDSTGDGSASPSDIGSISDLSSGYQNNFNSDASVTGIFNIFNSNNMGWFSQETANQLDTTVSTRRGSSFETPLLDQQINDIYDQIGVKHD